jgi:predicted small secreted protein
MKRLLPCLMILLGVSLLGAGCATNSGGGQPSTGTSTGSSAPPTSPPGEVYTPPVAVPPSNP